MKTLNLTEAAQFLKLHPEEVRRRAKAGIIPGAKLGKRWAFIEDDLADHIRSLYACTRQALQVGHEEKKLCHSLNVVKRGGFDSLHQAASALDALLQQKIKPKPKNSTTG
ncbi:MAG TPA: helix-turn-helix domain-containing protein [Nitrosomonas sp.]|nr:helix-turn-helix domain-containing protein [Nitrosomonas sp.]HMW21639.1 helix-turn-helix domain-containing protein [Nitrosomonas sp.]HMW70115.1 helix-turn-helix domain-containing protein [Nitrosomonas sp.]HMY62635.1 helix-turn-helix domain-containing protein [Nitrosomonas sp.]HMY91464.1 helix-turn-helix domain-containing protein [Nitrosomonas sp.]